MAKRIEDIVLLDAYLNDQLGGREKKAVEKRLQLDAKFAELANDLEIFSEGIKRKYKERLKAELQLFEKTLPAIERYHDETVISSNRSRQSEASSGSYKVWWKKYVSLGIPAEKLAKTWLSTVGSIVVIGIIIWLLMPNRSPEERLFAEYFEPTKMEETRSRTVKTKEQLRAEATQEFNKDHFTNAIPLLQELFESHKDTTSLYFMGLAQLGNGQISEAIQSLTLYNSTYKDVRYSRINYYIGLAHLRARRYDLAISFLEKNQSVRSDQLIKEIKSLQLQTN